MLKVSKTYPVPLSLIFLSQFNFHIDLKNEEWKNEDFFLKDANSFSIETKDAIVDQDHDQPIFSKLEIKKFIHEEVKSQLNEKLPSEVKRNFENCNK